MKKLAVFIGVTVVIITCISYVYLNYKIDYNRTMVKNKEYNKYYEQELSGIELTTLINKVADSNIKNNVEKDEKGNYINNKKDSIKIDIKFTDDDKVHTFEEIYNSGVETFMLYYNEIKFKCTKIEYHQSTNRISYLYFEQITG